MVFILFLSLCVQVPMEPRKGHLAPLELGLQVVVSHPSKHWELNSSPWQDQQVLLFCFGFGCFGDKITLRRPGCSGTHHTDYAGHELTEIRLSLPPECTTTAWQS